MSHFADRLAENIRRKGNALCVGIDPRWESLPLSIRERFGLEGIGAAYEAFGLKVLDLVANLAPVVKPQAAFFEQAGVAGFTALASILSRAKELGLVTILDAKRGDIASTAAAYAEAAFGPVWNADSVTVNPYLGEDAVEPFITAARKRDCGLFVLVRTSNKGAGLFQDLICDGKPVYRHVADAVASWSAVRLGDCGLGDVGAVVGATHPRELAELREMMPDVWFLVPGYGAQGGTAADVQAAFLGNGLGAIVNSSRGITFPFHPDDANWEAKIVEATKKAVAELVIS